MSSVDDYSGVFLDDSRMVHATIIFKNSVPIVMPMKMKTASLIGDAWRNWMDEIKEKSSIGENVFNRFFDIDSDKGYRFTLLLGDISAFFILPMEYPKAEENETAKESN